MKKAGIIGIQHDCNKDLSDKRILFGGRLFNAGVPVIFSKAQLHSAHHYVLKVFYSRESDTSSWHVALKAPPREFHDIEISSEGDDYTPYVALDKSIIDLMCTDEDVYHARNYCDGFYV